MSKYIDIVFDGPPSHVTGRFVEVENDDGKSIRAGEWIDRGDGYWALRIAQPAPLKLEDVAMLCDHGYAICARCDMVPGSWRVAP